MNLKYWRDGRYKEEKDSPAQASPLFLLELHLGGTGEVLIQKKGAYCEYVKTINRLKTLQQYSFLKSLESEGQYLVVGSSNRELGGDPWRFLAIPIPHGPTLDI